MIFHCTTSFLGESLIGGSHPTRFPEPPKRRGNRRATPSWGTRKRNTTIW
jgi:hypothetical protein